MREGEGQLKTFAPGTPVKRGPNAQNFGSINSKIKHGKNNMENNV